MTDIKQLITEVRQRVLAGEQVPRDLLRDALAAARREFSAASSTEKKPKGKNQISAQEAENLLKGWQ